MGKRDVKKNEIWIWPVLRLQRGYAGGTRATMDDGSRYSGYDGYIVGGTWPTIIMR